LNKDNAALAKRLAELKRAEEETKGGFDGGAEQSKQRLAALGIEHNISSFVSNN
jgi:hypothetical protein